MTKSVVISQQANHGHLCMPLIHFRPFQGFLIAADFFIIAVFLLLHSKAFFLVQE